MWDPAFSGADEAAAVAAAAAAGCAPAARAFPAVQRRRPSAAAQTSLPAHAAAPSAPGLHGFRSQVAHDAVVHGSSDDIRSTGHGYPAHSPR